MKVLEIKAAVRARDGWRCCDCGLTNDESIRRYGKQLDVHRKRPGSKYSVKGCETLCRRCHRRKPVSSHFHRNADGAVWWRDYSGPAQKCRSYLVRPMRI